MGEQEQFLEILNEIKDIAALQDNKLTKEEIKKYLSDIKLSDDKIDAICHYLNSVGIKICDMQESTKPNITDSDTALINRKLYMQDEETNSIIKDLLMGDISAKNKLAKSKLNHVIKLASNYKKHRAVINQTVSMDEIIAEGNMGLLIGISIIEKNRMQYFKSDGQPDYETVDGIINMEIINAMESMIDMVSENEDWENAVLAKINLLHEASKYLAEEYGRIPSKEELSAYTKVSAKEIDDIMTLSNDIKKVISSKSYY